MRASANVMSPRFGWPSLPKVWLPMLTEAGQLYRPSSGYPAATAAAVEVILKVEPGAYWPWVAQLMIVFPWVLLMASFPLHENLEFGIAYHLYSLPATVLTDFDASRHRSARDILGNGVDKDGIAGDLPEVVWRRRSVPWEASQLERKNVLLLVLESARYDLLDARVDGVPVMPVLSSLPGERLLMFSHAGYTVPSLGAIFNGTVDEREAGGISLVDRFRELGYQTAVFSGQYEGFGDISARTHMNRADVFVDASSFPKGQRMYASTAASALSVPAPLVAERFRRWFRSIDHQRPFFAYLNWQEMHFP